jgi:DNA-binding transcriptional regulator of glucitol operon
VFALLALQNLLGYVLQTGQYRKIMQKWLGRGVIGVGRSPFFCIPGELAVLVYRPREDRVLAVLRLRGLTVFARFREQGEYEGLSLEAFRRRAGTGGALYRALEAVERRLEKTAASRPAESAVLPPSAAAPPGPAAAVEAAGPESAAPVAESAGPFSAAMPPPGPAAAVEAAGPESAANPAEAAANPRPDGSGPGPGGSIPDPGGSILNPGPGGGALPAVVAANPAAPEAAAGTGEPGV